MELNRVSFWFAVGLVLVSGVGIRAEASEHRHSGGDEVLVPYGGGGGEIPSPFDFNEHVELADGELYILVGRVIISPDNSGALYPYFAVDLASQPWLANSKRRSNPLYPLEGSVVDWQRYSGAMVKMSARAHGRVVGSQYVITLKAVPAFSAQ